MDATDWRAQLQPVICQRKVNEIMSKLAKHHPVPDDNELLEVRKIAQSFERKTYACAISQVDYLQKISFMMSPFEAQRQEEVYQKLQEQQMLQTHHLKQKFLQQKLLRQQLLHRQQMLQQLGNNVRGLQQQQQMLGPHSCNSGMPTSQHSAHMRQQSKVPMQQQSQQNASNMLPSQVQQQQPQASQQQLMSQIQSQPTQLQQQMGLQQQPNSLQRDMQQRLQSSGSLLQQQNVLDQQKKLYQSQRTLPETSSKPIVAEELPFEE